VLLVSCFVLDLIVVALNANLLHPSVYGDPSLLKVIVEPAMVAGELSALEAKVDQLLLVAAPYIARFEEVAFLLSAALAAGRGKVAEHLLEIGIFAENGSVKHFGKALGVDVEVP
jgi:hypothetical protein